MSYGFFSILSIVFYQLLWSRMEVRFSVLRYYILHFNQYYVQLMSLSFLIIFFPIWLRCETYFQAISFIDRYLSLFFSFPICVVSTSLFAQWRVYFNHSSSPSICLHCQFRLILSNHAETRYIFLYIFPTCSDVSGGSKRIFCRGIRDISIEVLCPTCLSLKVYQSIQYLKCVCSRFLFTSAGKLTS